MEKLQKTKDRNEIIDAIRGLAMLWIVSYHIWLISWLAPVIKIFNFTLDLSFLVRDGYLGVELFIFISGFSLFYPYAKSIFTDTPPLKFGEFFKKRALRIIPSYYLAIGLGMMITIILDPGKISTFKDGLWHVLTHMLFIHNLFYDTYDSLLSVLWMMGIIGQFYLLFPVICAAFRKKPLLTFGLLSLVSFFYRYLVVTYWVNDLTRLMSMLPAFLDIFLFGMAAAYVVYYLKQYGAQIAKIRLLFTLAALAAFWCFILLIRNSYKTILEVNNGYGIWQNSNRFILSFVFFIFTISATYAHRIFRMLFANPVCRFLAGISYSLYFWHQEIGNIIANKHLIPALTPDQRSDKQWQIWFTVIVFGISFIVAAILTFGFERPLIKYLPRLWKKIRRKDSAKQETVPKQPEETLNDYPETNLKIEEPEQK